MRVGEPTEDIALTPESFFPATGQCNVEKLNGGPALKAPIATLCQPNGTHAALSNLREQRVRTRLLASMGSGQRQFKRSFFEKALGRKCLMLFE